MFSRACEYGIRAAAYIASKSQQGNKVGLIEIAKQINSPVAFTAKILQQLTKNNIVDSVRGPSGGFNISKEKAEKIKLSKIVTVIDGDSLFIGCGLGLRNCDENNPCPIHHLFVHIRTDLKQMLDTVSLNDLSNGINDGITFLKG